MRIPEWHLRANVWFAVVFLVLLVARLPALLGPINLSPDATEYIDIARNFAAGEGLTLKIRAYFFGDGLGVPFPAASLRSPLFPVFLGSVYALVPSNYVFQWFNLALFLLNMLLLALILRPILPPKLAAYALLLIGLAEPVFLTSIFPWAEQTAFFWLLAGLLLVSREAHAQWGLAGAALEGLVAAMATLSRPEYILVGILLLAWLAASSRRRAATLSVFLAAFLLPLVISSAAGFLAHGRTFLPGDYLFRSGHYAAYFAWEKPQRAESFLAANWFWIIERVLRNAVNYTAKLVGWKDLFVLALALPLVLLKGIRGTYPWRLRHLALVAAAFFCAYSLIWAGIDRERYLLAVTPFLLPLCLLELARWRQEATRAWMRLACLILMGANLPFFLGNTVWAGMAVQRGASFGERFYAAHNPAWSNPDISELANWIRTNVARDAVLCLENPFLLNYLTGRPAVALPEQIQAPEFPRFLNYYGVSYFVNNTVFTKRAPSELERLEQALIRSGAHQASNSGSYRIWLIARRRDERTVPAGASPSAVTPSAGIGREKP